MVGVPRHPAQQRGPQSARGGPPRTPPATRERPPRPAGTRSTGRTGDPSALLGQRPPVRARWGRDPCHRTLEPARGTVADLERGDHPGEGVPERAVGGDHRAGPAGRRDRRRSPDHHPGAGAIGGGGVARHRRHGRLVEINREEVELSPAIHRLRRAYLRVAPALEPSCSTGHHDDEQALAASYLLAGPRRWRSGQFLVVWAALLCCNAAPWTRCAARTPRLPTPPDNPRTTCRFGCPRSSRWSAQLQANTQDPSGMADLAGGTHGGTDDQSRDGPPRRRARRCRGGGSSATPIEQFGRSSRRGSFLA
jgi:hypothetical protein